MIVPKEKIEEAVKQALSKENNPKRGSHKASS